MAHASGRCHAWTAVLLSAAIDALSAGLAIDTPDEGLVFLDEADLTSRRLFLISAGNVPMDRIEDGHLEQSDLEPIEDPGQAWNGLTVGGFTEKVDLSAAPEFAGWTAVAREGELAPFSRTSVPFARAWPIKPDVVLEAWKRCNIARRYRVRYAGGLAATDYARAIRRSAAAHGCMCHQSCNIAGRAHWSVDTR